MDTISIILFGAEAVSILTGIVFLLKFFYNIYARKGTFAENKNYLIAAFIFIIVDPLLIILLGKVLAAHYSEHVLNYTTAGFG